MARGARHIPDGLKISSVLMKTTELAKLRKMVKTGEQRPLTAADFKLLLRVRFALREHERDLKDLGNVGGSGFDLKG